MSLADGLIAASYEGVLFPVSEFHIDEGNDLIEHTSYRKNGADLDSAGSKAQRGGFTIMIADTPDLVQRYGRPFSLRQRLTDIFRQTPIGSLAHPLIGNLTAGIGAVHWSMSSDKRSVISGSAEWIEDNASGQSVLELRDDPSAAAPEAVAANADTAAQSARVAGYTPVAPTVASQFAALPPSPSYGQVASAFSAITRAINANLALPAMATSGASPVVAALGILGATLARSRNALLPGLTNAPTFTVPPGGLPLWRIAASAYRDPAQAALLLRANPITSPRLVPAGTVLRLPARSA